MLLISQTDTGLSRLDQLLQAQPCHQAALCEEVGCSFADNYFKLVPCNVRMKLPKDRLVEEQLVEWDRPNRFCFAIDIHSQGNGTPRWVAYF